MKEQPPAMKTKEKEEDFPTPGSDFDFLNRISSKKKNEISMI